jgi:putative chitinase
MDRKVFFDTIRPAVQLTEPNVAGFEKVLAYAEDRGTQLDYLAYILPTGYIETAMTMQPVREAFWLSEAWRKKNLRYWPWYGRGLIQTTWEDNYRKLAVAMGLPEDTFIKNPDLLLEWEHALPAMFVGMERGLYTGKKLGDYIDGADESDAEDLREFTNARRIVNGTDRAAEIGKLALVFEKALRASGYAPKPPEPTPPETAPADEQYPLLKRGSLGPAVRELQRLLNEKGTTPPLDIDGAFGGDTLKALEAYQKGLVEYGVVGKLTWAALLA